MRLFCSRLSAAVFTFCTLHSHHYAMRVHQWFQWQWIHLYKYVSHHQLYQPLSYSLVLFPDVNECSEGIDNCHTNAVCTDTIGSFQCTCSSGFTGDGATCTSIIIAACTWFSVRRKTLELYSIINFRYQ